MYRGIMNEKIKKHLEAICKRDGYGISDADLLGAITDAKELYTEMGDEHRWYTKQLKVFDVGGMIIGYQDFYMTGDMCVGDTDLEYDLGEIKEYEPKEITKTIYVPKTETA